MTPPAQTPSVRIRRGRASDVEAVAVLLALDVVRRADEDAARATGARRPAWREAARIEGVTPRRFPALADLRGPLGRLG